MLNFIKHYIWRVFTVMEAVSAKLDLYDILFKLEILPTFFWRNFISVSVWETFCLISWIFWFAVLHMVSFYTTTSAVWTIDSTLLAMLSKSLQVFVGSFLSIKYSLTLESVLQIMKKGFDNFLLLFESTFSYKFFYPHLKLSLVITIWAI